MSSSTFGLIIFGTMITGVIVYGVIVLKAAKLLHDSQRDYYTWLKHGGGQVRDIASLYSKEDVERLQR